MDEMAQGWNPNTSYRQGSVLLDDVATQTLGIPHNKGFAVVISHDCDITNIDTTKEPCIEVVIAQAITHMDGNYSQAKNPRILHLEFSRNDRPWPMELVATEKRVISKNKLLVSAPDATFSLADKNRKILQRWLAARYRRHAFPDTLNRRLGQAFEKNIKKSADEVLAVFIDYQPRNAELSEDEPYELWLYVVADTAKPESIEKATTIAQALKEALSNQRGLDIVECDAKADTEFTLADTRRFDEFRLEHLSFRHEPFGAIAEY